MSFLSLLDAFDKAIAAAQFNGYGRTPLPNELDALVESFVEAYVLADPSERELAEALPRMASEVLTAYCEREATLAVRLRSARALRLSLLAAGIAAVLGDDPREIMLVLVLPWRTARHLALYSAPEFAAAAAQLPKLAAEELLAFARRQPEDQTLECMGYREVGAGESFRYERTW